MLTMQLRVPVRPLRMQKLHTRYEGLCEGNHSGTSTRSESTAVALQALSPDWQGNLWPPISYSASRPPRPKELRAYVFLEELARGHSAQWNHRDEGEALTLVQE